MQFNEDTAVSRGLSSNLPFLFEHFVLETSLKEA